MDFKDLEGLEGAMYLRKSRMDIEAEARGEGETLSKHKKYLKDNLIDKYKLYIPESNVFEEVVSGEKIAYRPEMQKLLDGVENNPNWRYVLCMDLDRLGRGDMRDQGYIQEAFKSSNTLIVTSRKIYDLNDELDEEWSEFESFMARRELKIITRRLQRGRIQTVKSGKYIGTNAPFGYDKNSDNILIPNDKADIVKQIFNWYVNGDEDGNPMGSTKISNRLNELQIKSPTGIPWYPTSIIAILKNEVYIGKIQWKRKLINKKAKIYKTRNRSEWIEVEDCHESLIDNETFTKAQKMLGEHTNPSVRTKKPRNPLAGLVVCAGCEKKMVMQGGSGKSKRIVMLKCTTPGCVVTSSSFHRVEEQVLEDLEGYLKELILEESEIRKGLEENKTVENPYPKMIEELKREIKELEKQENSLDELLERGVYSIEKYAKRSKKIVDDLKTKREALENLESMNTKHEDKLDRVQKQIDVVTNVITEYRLNESITTKNRLLKSVLEIIIYDRRNSNWMGEFTLKLGVKGM